MRSQDSTNCFSSSEKLGRANDVRKRGAHDALRHRRKRQGEGADDDREQRQIETREEQWGEIGMGLHT